MHADFLLLFAPIKHFFYCGMSNAAAQKHQGANSLLTKLNLKPHIAESMTKVMIHHNEQLRDYTYHEMFKSH